MKYHTFVSTFLGVILRLGMSRAAGRAALKN